MDDITLKVDHLKAGYDGKTVLNDISFANYFQSIRDGIPPILFLKSTVKSIAFGWLVTLISCNKGLNAEGGAEAVGLATTSSVVVSISAIIVADCAFSFIFY